MRALIREAALLAGLALASGSVFTPPAHATGPVSCETALEEVRQELLGTGTVGGAPATAELRGFSRQVADLCEECPKQYSVTPRSVAHSNQHYPGEPILDIRTAQKYARADRSTTVFADGTKVDDILPEIEKARKVAFDAKARELMANGNDTIAFDVEVVRQTSSGPQTVKMRLVTCIKLSCADDAGGVVTQGAFKEGDVISVFPVCGDGVMSIPKAADVAASVAKYKPESPLGTGSGKIKAVPCK